MKRFGFALGLLLFLASSVMAKEVNVILKDKSLVKGELIGISEGVIYLKTAGNKLEQFGVEKVSAVFDAATGDTIETGIPGRSQNGTVKSKSSNVEPLESVAQKPAPILAPVPQASKSLLFIFGTMDSGYMNPPCRPLEDTYQPYSAYVIGMQPYDSAWGAGMSMEYRFVDSIAGCLDFGISRWEKLLAKEGGYAVGAWVWEQNDYYDARVGPFPMDVKYYMDTVAIRLGAKYYPMTGFFQPFIGFSLGIYAWDATIGNREEEKKYSETSSGSTLSTTMQVGVDFVLDGFALRIFGDFGAPVANPYFENLFRSGWTFDDSEHMQGPYRYGIAVGMTM